MEGTAPRECVCGSGNFERVTVRRPNGAPYRTDFIACAECRLMYFSPEAPRLPTEQWVDAMPPGYERVKFWLPPEER